MIYRNKNEERLILQQVQEERSGIMNLCLLLSLSKYQDERGGNMNIEIKRSKLYILLGFTIFLLDRITKLAALAYCAQEACVVNPYFSFDVVFNRGVSWGMLHSSTNSLFISVSAVIAIITAFLCWHAYHNWRAGNTIIGHVCIIAGSIGNLVDRALYAGVIDFILLSYKTVSWPVFNVADAAIVLGVFLLIFFDEKSV